MGAQDKYGRPMTLYPMFTICDAADGLQAQQYAFQFMSDPERGKNPVLEDMMNLRLRPVGTETITHWGCFREAWTDERDAQIAGHARDWVDLPSFRLIELPLQDALNSLGLEIAADVTVPEET